MDNRVIQVPVAFLQAPDLTAAAKVLWMAQRLHPGAGPGVLEAGSGLSRDTLLALRSTVDAYSRPFTGRRANMPAALLAERSVGPRAKLLYGLLQTLPGKALTYPELAAATHMSANTLKRAVGDLVDAGWAKATRAHRLRPIRFTLGTPALRRAQAEAARAGRRLERAPNTGEALMHEYLSLLIDSDEYTDNAREGFLTNPKTGERLELDRFYRTARVAFEFHGSQHSHASERFSQAEVDKQIQRDLIKAGLCVYQEIHLVIVLAEDLSLSGMTRKVGRWMPLRPLAGHEPLVDLLEEKSLTYRAEAETAAKRQRQPGGK